MFNLNNLEVLHLWTGFEIAAAIWNLRFGWHSSTREPITRDSKLMLKSSSKLETSNLIQFLLKSMGFFHRIHWPSVETKCALYFVTKRVKSKRIFSSQTVFSPEKSHNLELWDLQTPFVPSWRNKMSPNTNIPISFMCHVSGIKIFFSGCDSKTLQKSAIILKKSNFCLESMPISFRTLH